VEKKEILNNFSVTSKQEGLLDQFIKQLLLYNQHTNIVGKSTLANPWRNHVLDSLQILPLIESKSLSILDMGTGAGLPGIILSIAGCKNVTLVDSNGKKINFLKNVKRTLSLKTDIVLGRVESLKNRKYDIVTCRALANLKKLLSYSQKLIKKNTVLIFLKGKTVNEELMDARKDWNFDFEKHQSISDSRGKILIIKNLKKI